MRIIARGAAVVLLGACAASAETAPTSTPAAEPASETSDSISPAPADRGIGPRDTVAPNEIRLSGAVASPSAGDVQRAVRGASPALSACYDTAVAERPGLEGRIVLDLECVDGRCISVRVIEDGVGSPPLSACVTGVLTGLRFNPQPDRVTVRLPLAFALPSAGVPETDAGRK
jgi:hypothetical protein